MLIFRFPYVTFFLLSFFFLFTNIQIAQIKAKTDYDTVDRNRSLNVPAPGVLANDITPDNKTLSIVGFTVEGLFYKPGKTASTYEASSITLYSDGSYSISSRQGFTGDIPTISYTVSDGINTANASLFLTIEPTTNLFEINSLSSNNQGYTKEGVYEISYRLEFSNKSNAKDYHESSILKDVNLEIDLKETFGEGCYTLRGSHSHIEQVEDFIGDPYPKMFNAERINTEFRRGNSNTFFKNGLSLYPRQKVLVYFCVQIDPFCNGRPKPTPSGSKVDFDLKFKLSSKNHSAKRNLLLQDFHTHKTTVAAGLFIPEPDPKVNPDRTFSYTNSVFIVNEGEVSAKNINFNLGLGDFIKNGISFNKIEIRQISGPEVTINQKYNGISEPLLLTSGNHLSPNSTIQLEINFKTNPVFSSSKIDYSQLQISQTQGNLDGFDEKLYRKFLSYVLWSDKHGNHLDVYTQVNSEEAEEISSNNQCSNSTPWFMLFKVQETFHIENRIEILNTSPNGILEHEELKFTINIINSINTIQLTNLQIQNELEKTCNGSFTIKKPPIILNSNADQTPILNPNFNGISDIGIFDGNSGLLKANQFLTIEFTVVFTSDCKSINTSSFTALNVFNETVRYNDTIDVVIFTNSDEDIIANVEDADDDNDTIPDTIESNGINPSLDDDSDNIPNYRDTDFGVDNNLDGVVDIFDFDSDGIPNHLDIDSDNDGILDIVEAGYTSYDSDKNGQTDYNVGLNGLENSLETDDSNSATFSYILPNTDKNGNPNFIDIDADDDGIVDNIEAQNTFAYIVPKNNISAFGLDISYPEALNPIDTDEDGIPDYLDLNSDNDTKNDTEEGWDTDDNKLTPKLFSNIDKDNDGLDDAFDNNINSFDATNGQTPFDFPNFDNLDTEERDWREVIAVLVFIEDVVQTEGKDFTFTISLVKKRDKSEFKERDYPVTIDFFTSDGSETVNEFNVATVIFDYNKTSTTLTFDPFVTTKTLSVSSLEDNIYELDEFFTLTGNVVSNNTVNNITKNDGIILDNDRPPSITMNNSEALEGDHLNHTIEISHPSSTPIIIDVSTTDKTASSAEDYTAYSKSIRINPTTDANNPNLKVSFEIVSHLDNINELYKEVILVSGVVSTQNVSNPYLTKTATIIDVDPYPIVNITNSNTAIEGEKLLFKISLVNDKEELMQNYLPIDIQIETQDITATKNRDYKGFSNNITIPSKQSTVDITVTSLDDKISEPRESFLLKTTILPINDAVVSTSFGNGFINDNDYSNLFSPNNDGKDDTFIISGLESYPNFRIRIVDRWGKEVFKYNNKGSANPIWWDGNIKGKQAPEGVYFYTLDFNDNITKPRISFLQLVR